MLYKKSCLIPLVTLIFFTGCDSAHRKQDSKNGAGSQEVAVAPSPSVESPKLATTNTVPAVRTITSDERIEIDTAIESINTNLAAAQEDESQIRDFVEKYGIAFREAEVVNMKAAGDVASQNAAFWTRAAQTCSVTPTECLNYVDHITKSDIKISYGKFTEVSTALKAKAYCRNQVRLAFQAKLIDEKQVNEFKVTGSGVIFSVLGNPASGLVGTAPCDAIYANEVEPDSYVRIPDKPSSNPRSKTDSNKAEFEAMEQYQNAVCKKDRYDTFMLDILSHSDFRLAELLNLRAIYEIRGDRTSRYRGVDECSATFPRPLPPSEVN